MFTGIVEAVAKIKEIKGNKLLKIETPWEINPGDSISIDGVCLTVKEYKTHTFLVEAAEKTIETTLIQNYKRGDLVNLERALPIDGRLGGHFVTGHIDEKGRIRTIRKYSGYHSFEIETSKKGMKYIIEKGSVAVNGISLTIAGVKSNSFLANIIPYTLEYTNLSYKKAGDFVNIEYDYLAKLVYKYLVGQGFSLIRVTQGGILYAAEKLFAYLMPLLRPKIYKYTTELHWTRRHRGILRLNGKSDIEIGCPPEFGGEPGVWSAEDLFVASVNICIMTTFLDIMDKAKKKIVSYKSKALGKACLVMKEKAFRFIGVEVYPIIKVRRKREKAIAEEAIEKAGRECMVSRSLKFEPVVKPKIKIVS